MFLKKCHWPTVASDHQVCNVLAKVPQSETTAVISIGNTVKFPKKIVAVGHPEMICIYLIGDAAKFVLLYSCASRLELVKFS